MRKLWGRLGGWLRTIPSQFVRVSVSHVSKHAPAYSYMSYNALGSGDLFFGHDGDRQGGFSSLFTPKHPSPPARYSPLSLPQGTTLEGKYRHGLLRTSDMTTRP